MQVLNSRRENKLHKSLLTVFVFAGCAVWLCSAAQAQPATGEVAVATPQAEGELTWRRTETSLGLDRGHTTLWEFHFDPRQDAPYFDPVRANGSSLTWDSPPDHAWHHGIWFSWKFINGINYWEHNRRTGKPDGRTRWRLVSLETKMDGSASLRLQLDYGPATEDRVLLTEDRRIEIGPPDVEDGFVLDWESNFRVGDQAVLLDRTPPREQSWGGYAGLSIRFAEGLRERQLIDLQGQAEFDAGDRHRSRSPAMDYNGVLDGQAAGIAFLDHPNNPRHPTPWYAIRSPQMSYLNAALLAEAPLQLSAHEALRLRYRLVVHPGRWDSKRLAAAYEGFVKHFSEGFRSSSQNE